ncbi:MAG: von Willebrand factor type A [uncultured bacterium]|nr:MAG: von Willebrand factor type A [uncultured bacterium]
MFENVPQAPIKPVAPVANPQTATGDSGALPKLPKGLPPIMPTKAVMADKATIDLYKRTGLSGRQKIILVIVTIVVLSALIGGGIWIYYTIDPAGNSGNANNSTNNANAINIPLQDLDTDEDGVRDIDEKRYNTDINLSDTDADGLNDYLEIFQYKTNPTVADTDVDGYLDGNEVDNGYDPNGPGKLAQ